MEVIEECIEGTGKVHLTLGFLKGHPDQRCLKVHLGKGTVALGVKVHPSDLNLPLLSYEFG